MSNPLMELLAAHAGGGAGPSSISVDPSQHPEAQSGAAGPTGASGGAADALKAALSSIHQYVEQADDEPDKQIALQCYAKLQGILATEQKEKETALGVTPAHKMMAKQTAAASGGY